MIDAWDETRDDTKAMAFNETCCAHSGVPEECMGLCRQRHRRSALNDLPPNRCDKHLQKINSCVYEGIMKLSYNNFEYSISGKEIIWVLIKLLN